MILANLRQDVRYALRMLRQTPVFTAVAVGSLALGIGANTAIFTLADALLLRFLPVENPQELVVLVRGIPERPDGSFNYPDYRYVRDHSQSYTGLIAFGGSGRGGVGFRLPGSGGASQLVAMSMVTGNYFELLGVRAAIGRLFNPADNETEGAHPYVVLSHSFWQRTFGENTGVVGRQVLLNGNSFQVIGVTQEGFTGTNLGSPPDIYVPIIMYRTFNPTALSWNSRSSWWLTVIGRLKPGVSRQQAGSEFNILWHQILAADPLERERPWDKEYKLNNTGTAIDGGQGSSGLRNQTRRPLTVLMITVGLVLLIACANVANLLLARAVARRKEIAVRLAVGASRSRLISQMLTESVTLSVLGGVAGLGVAWLGVKVLVGFLPRGTFPVELSLSPDARVLGFAFGLAVLSGVIFGLAPAFRATRTDLVLDLKSDTKTSRRIRWDLRRSLVALQVALSLFLLGGAALFIRTLVNLRNVDPGMVRENLLFVETNLGQMGYQPQRERIFQENLREQAQRMPGVRAASFANIAPLAGGRWNGTLTVEGYTWGPKERPIVDRNAVTPRFFESAGIAILLGRDFRDSDNLPVLPDRPAKPPARGERPPNLPGPPRVAIVNEAYAKKFFRGQSPIGRRLIFEDKWDAERVIEIVGMVRDARYFSVKRDVEPMVYHPIYRERFGTGQLTVRTTGDPTRLVESIRRSVLQLDSAVSVTQTRTMEDNLNRNLVQERFIATLGGFFGVVALLLAAIGLYAVMAQSVTGRTREIGIRMALGAENRKVLWMVLRDAMAMVLIGLIAGVPAIVAAIRYSVKYAETMLYGVKAEDPSTFGAVAFLLLAVTAFAAFVPARRATRVEPIKALRQE